MKDELYTKARKLVHELRKENMDTNDILFFLGCAFADAQCSTGLSFMRFLQGIEYVYGDRKES